MKSRTTVLALAAVLSLLIGAVGASHGVSEAQSPQGTIFIHRGEVWDDTDIYWVSPDGCTEGLFYASDLNDIQSRVSPDGTKVLFRRGTNDQAGRGDILTINIDGTGVQSLTSGSAIDWEPSWSPDGTQISFVRYWDIYTMDSDGSNITRIVAEDEIRKARFGSDGRIYHGAFPSGANRTELFRVDADGSNRERLTFTPDHYDFDANLSPDGTKLAFARDTITTPADLWVMDPGGGNEVQLTATSANERSPVWSPDGSMIAYISDADGDWEVFVMNADGTDPQQITFNTVTDWTNYWTDVVFGGCENEPPIVTGDNASVTAAEGQSVSNSGTVSDPDDDPVSLTASIGDVTNHEDGTWDWSYLTADGPAESQTVTISADDGNGGVEQVSFELTVNNVAPTVDSITVPMLPVDFSTHASFQVVATFSDPAGANDEPYTCGFDFDNDGMDETTVSNVTGTSCSAALSYAGPGVYTVKVTVTDKDGDSGSAKATEYIVVYDPAGGFVTGGGWIDSPPGAYITDSYFNHFTDLDGWIQEVGLITGHCRDPLNQRDSVVVLPNKGGAYLDLQNPIVGSSDASVEIVVRFRHEARAGFKIGFTRTADVICGSQGDYQNDGIVFSVWREDYDTVSAVATHNGQQDWIVAQASEVFDGDWHVGKLYRDSSGRWTLYVDDEFLGQTADEDRNLDYRYLTVQGGGSGTMEIDYVSVATVEPGKVGRANFGFVSKYKKDADVPSGETEFQFKAGNLNFHSGSYDWLVVAGHKAKYKGLGTINGEGNYGFMLSAIDEKLTPSTDVDLFRIKIWDIDQGDMVVYDNQVDEAEDADPTTAIGGGSIVIHKAK